MMKKLAAYIEELEVEYCEDRVEAEFVPKIEEMLSMTLGAFLVEYILQYGYLIYGSVELYGITKRQGLDSDMIKQTNYLHKYFDKTRNFIAIENVGEGDYYLVDSADNVFEYDSELDELIDAKMKLEDYLISRFSEME